MKSKLFKHMSLPEMYSLEVDKDNKIYFEVSGKKDGIPVFFVHGGQVVIVEVNIIPYLTLKFLNLLFLIKEDVVKVHPTDHLREITTENLVEDIEKIRDFLKVKKFL